VAGFELFPPAPPLLPYAAARVAYVPGALPLFAMPGFCILPCAACAACAACAWLMALSAVFIPVTPPLAHIEVLLASELSGAIL
jgi:hypothetical protein